MLYNCFVSLVLLRLGELGRWEVMAEPGWMAECGGCVILWLNWGQQEHTREHRKGSWVEPRCAGFPPVTVHVFLSHTDYMQCCAISS